MNLINCITLLIFQSVFLVFVAASAELAALANQSPDFIIRAHDGSLDMLDKIRNYYTVITLTSTDPAHGCEVCLELDKVLAEASNAWHQKYGHMNLVYFVTVDLVDPTNMRFLQALQIDTVPHTWMIPPTSPEAEQELESVVNYDSLSVFNTPNAAFKLPKTSFDNQVSQFYKFLTDLTGHPIAREESPITKFAKTFIIVFTIIMVLKKQGKQKFSGVKKKHFYILFTLTLTLIFLGGYQFTLDHGVPFVARNEKGLIVISGGTLYQFGIEIVLVAVNYASLAASLVLLIYIGQYKVTDTARLKSELVKFILILVNNLALYLLYSCLTSMFLRKDGGYEFALTRLF
jgi:oligosaccharyltransferase complex subunit gamma